MQIEICLNQTISVQYITIFCTDGDKNMYHSNNLFNKKTFIYCFYFMHMVIEICIIQTVYKNIYLLLMFFTDGDRNMYYSNNYFNQESSNMHQPQGIK